MRTSIKRVVVSSSLVLILTAVPANAAFMLEFINGTWDHSSVGGPTNSNGWAVVPGTTAGYTQGVQEVEPGVFATVTSSVSGTAQRSAFNFSSGNALTTGFAISNLGLNDDNGAALINYHRVDVAFSSPVTIDALTVGDIDTATGTGLQTWKDAVALELWNGSAPVSPGDGIQPTVSFSANTNLQLNTTSYPIQFVDALTLGNTVSDARSTATYSSNAVIDGLSLYLWDTGRSNTNGRHAITLSAAGASFETVPEPSAASLVGLAVVGLVLRRSRRS